VFFMRTGSLVGLLAAAVIAAGVVQAAAQAWVCDDAFISFRYARNLIDGHGLVYNALERVEGYTNFLWTLLLAAGMALGADAAAFGNAAGIAFHFATVLVLLRASRRIAGAWFPVAAVGLSLHAHFLSFASCGLETAMFAFLVTALLAVLLEAQRPRAFLLAGVIGTAAAMTRPDGLLPYGIACLWTLALAAKHGGWRRCQAIAAPGALLYLPYFAWKWSYYGWPLPNTFYAKSAAHSWIGQGARYVALYLQCYWILVPALLACIWLVARGARAWDRFDGGRGGRGPLLIALLALPYLAFVIWVGGDFMFARFCLPITPALLLAFDVLRARIARPELALVLGAAVAVSSALHWYPDILRDPANSTGIVEERAFYPPEKMAASRAIGEQLRAITAGTDARVVIYGGQAVLAYYGEFPLVIEGSTGLTDEYIAHLPIHQRSRIGHEKHAPPEYLYRRRVDFRIGYHLYEDPLAELRVFDLGPVKGTFLIYRRELVETLVARGARVQRFEDHLDRYIARLADVPAERLRADLAWFKLYWFDHNADAERLRRLEAALGQ
jgi:hypothetical protein